MGHTRCIVHDCRLPLMNQTHRFCSHHNNRRYLCSVYGCDSAADPGFCTCSKQSHRAWEETRSALPQLRARYQQAGISEVPRAGNLTPTHTVAHAVRSDNSSITQENLPGSSADENARPIKGSASRKWTHNEQLFVRCCGVIISRATMYGSEGLTGVKVRLIVISSSAEN
jgi:hypothetical protein